MKQQSNIKFCFKLGENNYRSHESLNENEALSHTSQQPLNVQNLETVAKFMKWWTEAVK